MPKENMHYSCIDCITIDSVINFNKKNHPQVYLEECKYRIKKTQIPKFIKNESKSDSDSDDKELMAKLKDSDSDSDSDFEVELKFNVKKTLFWINLNKNFIIIDDYYLLLLMIICYCNQTNFRRRKYKVIRPVLNFLLIFYDKISQVQKSIKKNTRH